jgi:hypothetical protein
VLLEEIALIKVENVSQEQISIINLCDITIFLYFEMYIF